MKKIKYIYLIILILPLVFSGVYYLFNYQNEIIVVSSLPDNSAGAARGQSRGLELAFEEEKYKAGKYKIMWIPLVNTTEQGYSIDLEKKNAEFAINNKKVLAYFGPFNSDLGIISLPILNKAGVLQLSGSMTWPGLTKNSYRVGDPMKYYPTGKIHFFRVAPSDIVQGLVASSFIKQKNVKSVASIHDGSIYGRGVSSIFEKNCLEYGIILAATGSIEVPNESDTAIDNILKTNPGAVFVGAESVPNVSELYTGLRLGGYKGIIFGTNFTEKQISDSINISDKNVYTINPGKFYNDEDDIMVSFYENYKNRYKEEPPPYSYYAYISGKLILNAISNSNGTRKDVLDVFKTDLNTHIVNSKHIHFDFSGDLIEEFSGIFHMENGSWIFIQSIDIQK